MEEIVTALNKFNILNITIISSSKIKQFNKVVLNLFRIYNLHNLNVSSYSIKLLYLLKP